jgi:hypothetical protein
LAPRLALSIIGRFYRHEWDDARNISSAIYSITNGQFATVVCPIRLLENGVTLKGAATSEPSTAHSRRLKERSLGNSEITWLVYDFQKRERGGFQMQAPGVIHTVWDDVQEALREGEAPEREDILKQLSKAAIKQQKFLT